MTKESRPSHMERTAGEPRQSGLHRVILSSIRSANSRIRLLTLTLPYALHFLPGQWLDVHVPGLPKAGGFTITSRPSQASNESRTSDLRQKPGYEGPHLELAVQKSPSNPPAAWLWQPEQKILGAELQIRVGGQFTWPPFGLDAKKIDELVLIAGGVGINPLISILDHLDEQTRKGDQRSTQEHVPRKITLLYGTKADSMGLNGVLFYPRIYQLISGTPNRQWKCRMFLSGPQPTETYSSKEHSSVDISKGRMADEDILQTLPPLEARSRAAAYVCGPASMTDHIVSLLQQTDGMATENVLCEKWW